MVLGAAFDGQRTPRGERLKLRSKLKLMDVQLPSQKQSGWQLGEHNALTTDLKLISLGVCNLTFYRLVKRPRFFPQKKGGRSQWHLSDMHV